jgi:hypothetical protein
MILSAIWACSTSRIIKRKPIITQRSVRLDAGATPLLNSDQICLRLTRDCEFCFGVEGRNRWEQPTWSTSNANRHIYRINQAFKPPWPSASLSICSLSFQSVFLSLSCQWIPIPIIREGINNVQDNDQNRLFMRVSETCYHIHLFVQKVRFGFR